MYLNPWIGLGVLNKIGLKKEISFKTQKLILAKHWIWSPVIKISSPWRSRTAVERSRVSQDCHYPKGLKCKQLQLVNLKIKSPVSRFDFIVYNDLG